MAGDCRLESAVYHLLDNALQARKEKMQMAVRIQRLKKHKMLKKSNTVGRILCVVTPLGESKPRKLNMHLMKAQGENYELSKTYKGKLLQTVMRNKAVWELKFTMSSTLRIADTSPQMEAFLSKLIQMCHDYCGTNPTMGAASAAPKTLMEAMSDDSVSSEELRDLEPSDFLGLNVDDDFENPSPREVNATLLTVEEEESLSSALRMWYSVSESDQTLDIPQFVAVLQREQACLQTLNAKAVMETEDVYAKLQNDLASAAVILGDMEHTLQMCDSVLAKVNHDIELIQAQSSDLEIARAHHLAVEKEIQALRRSLTLDSRHENVLKQGPFKPKSELTSMLESAEALEALMDNAIKDSQKMKMKAVREQLQYYTALRNSYLGRLVTHLETQVQKLSLEFQGSRHRFSRKLLLVWLVHSEVFEELWPLAPLMKIMKLNAFPHYVAVQRKYATAMQVVYQKEIMNYFKIAKTFIEEAKTRKETILLGSTNQAQSLSLLVTAGASRMTLAPASPSYGHGPLSFRSRASSVCSDDMTDATASHRPNPPPRLPMYKAPAVKDSASVISTLDGDSKQRPDRAFANFLCTTAHVVAREHEFCSSFFGIVDEGELNSMLQELLSRQDIGAQSCVLSMELAAILKWMQKHCDQIYFLPCLSVISAVKEEYSGKCSYVSRILEQLEPTAQNILNDFLKDQIDSINECKLSLKHSFVAPYFAKFPLFCERIEALSTEMYCPKAAAIEAVYAQLMEAMFAALEQQVDPRHKLAAFYKFKNYAYFYHKAESFLPARLPHSNSEISWNGTHNDASNDDLLTSACGAADSTVSTSRAPTPKHEDAHPTGHTRTMSTSSSISNATSSTFDDASPTAGHRSVAHAIPQTPISFAMKQDTLSMSKNAAADRLQQCYKVATKRMQDYEIQYIRAMFKKSFSDLHSFIFGVQELLKSYEPREIAFQERYSNAAVADLVANVTKKAVREGLDDMTHRVRKHFFKQSSDHRSTLKGYGKPSSDSGVPPSECYLGIAISDDEFRQHLHAQIWNQLMEYIVQSFQQLRNILSQCYPRLKLALSDKELRTMVQSTRSHR